MLMRVGDSLVFVKLLLSPTLIGLASGIGRVCGPRAAGWFAALPLTSAPVVLLLALDHGASFAARASIGISLALPALAAFAITYSWVSRRRSWQWCSAAGCAAYALCALGEQWWVPSSTSIVIAVVAACVSLTVAIRLLPNDNEGHDRSTAPWWDIPVRMILAGVLVWGITVSARALGPRGAGLLTPFPVVATIMAAFTHHIDGAIAARRLIRSLLVGLFSFAVFFLLTGSLLERSPLGVTFAVAALGALALHGCLWRLTHRTSILALQAEGGSA
jgi:hypothetical protein